MGLKDMYKEIKKNVRSLDETMDRTDQEIEHFGHVLDITEDGIAKFTNCISKAEVAVHEIDQLTNHGEELVSKLHALVNVVENKEMIIMSFYGAIIVTFLISILIIENWISVLISNSKSNQADRITFFETIFDYMFLSVICFILRVLQLILFTIVTYSSLESFKKTILKKVEVEISPSTSTTNGTTSQLSSIEIPESPSKSIPSITLTTPILEPTISNESTDVTPVESPISSLANNVSSSTRTSKSDLANADELSSTSSTCSATTISEAIKSNLESALQIASSISHTTIEENHSSNTNAL
ncbi:predicted protein [Naegleria gruberi]|uniref:Predicted protein n=1 Tax=Naegleria gruberi TaxID=5762 RepID=D2W042_NAEGR|nr:uncharacterized protein NAEGRDRAFT_53645 [Naegleria gruberi]EFC37509.1 predicted protein [Naegleria gruberi]|eukprot:XP_002670253.1 predicted protein [Naegleria gruberi strain NEG-M]